MFSKKDCSKAPLIFPPFSVILITGYSTVEWAANRGDWQHETANASWLGTRPTSKTSDIYLRFNLCVARCIHASDSGNCPSRGIGTDVTCQWSPDVSTQSRVFISGSEIQGIVTYILVGGGAGEMAVGRKNSGWVAIVWVVMWVMGGAVNKKYVIIKYTVQWVRNNYINEKSCSKMW